MVSQSRIWSARERH